MRRSHRKSGSSTYTPRAPVPDKMYFKMGEVTKLVGVQAHVLRYWEKEIPAIRPDHSSANQRRYRRRDVELFREVRRLLYEEKFTLAGARRHLSGPLAPRMPPDPDAFVHDFDADPQLNDLTASIAEHDMYSPDLLQEMQETITKTLSDLTTSIAEHDMSGSDLLQELHDAITKTSTARPVVAPWRSGPAPTTADKIDAHRVSQGAAAYLERSANQAAAASHVAAQASADAQAQAEPEPEPDDQAAGDAPGSDDDAMVLAPSDDADATPTALKDDLGDAAMADASEDAKAWRDEDVGAMLQGSADAQGEDSADVETDTDVDTDTDGLPAAYIREGADAADDLRASNEGEDVLAISNSGDSIEAGRDIHGWDDGDNAEDVDAGAIATSEDAYAADAQANPSESENGLSGMADASESVDDSDTFRAWDHPIDPDTESERLSEEAVAGPDEQVNNYVLYRADEANAGPDISYEPTDATLAPDIAYVSGDHAEAHVAYVSGETSTAPDVSYTLSDEVDALDVAHASGQADAGFNSFRMQPDDSQTIELPCLSAQSASIPEISYASGLYEAPEISSDALHVGGLSGLPMAALHFAQQQGDGSASDDQATVGAWGAPAEPGYGMYGATGLTAQLPAAFYGAEATDDEDQASLQAAATAGEASTNAPAYQSWDSSEDAASDVPSGAESEMHRLAGETIDDLPDSPYAAFLSADHTSDVWPETSDDAFDFASASTEDAVDATGAIADGNHANDGISDDPAVLAAWEALSAIGTETSDDQAPALVAAATLEATSAAEASLEASRRQLRDAEVAPASSTGRVGAAASFEEGDEPAGGFYAYVESPADEVPPYDVIADATHSAIALQDTETAQGAAPQATHLASETSDGTGMPARASEPAFAHPPEEAGASHVVAPASHTAHASVSDDAGRDDLAPTDTALAAMMSEAPPEPPNPTVSHDFFTSAAEQAMGAPLASAEPSQRMAAPLVDASSAPAGAVSAGDAAHALASMGASTMPVSDVDTSSDQAPMPPLAAPAGDAVASNTQATTWMEAAAQPMMAVSDPVTQVDASVAAQSPATNTNDVTSESIRAALGAEMPASLAAPDVSYAYGADPEDIGSQPEGTFSGASYGMDLSYDDIANANPVDEVTKAIKDAPAAAILGAVVAADAVKAVEDAPATAMSEAVAEDAAKAVEEAPAAAMSEAVEEAPAAAMSEAVADESTGSLDADAPLSAPMVDSSEARMTEPMGLLASAVAALEEAKASDQDAPAEDTADDATPVSPATPPPFEHPPYYETPLQESLTVRLLRQKLRSGLQDILRIATE